MTVQKAPNETAEERAKREDAERLAKELVAETKDKAKDEDVIEARISESQAERDKRHAIHVSDERALNDVGRVREISDSLDRDEANYLQRRDNAIRRLRGLIGNPNKAVHDAVVAVAKRHNIEISSQGLTQPKTALKKGDLLYPFAD